MTEIRNDAERLREHLKTKKILADGAFGTYFAARYGTDRLPELFNTEDPEKVTAVHSAYIEAGSRLIRTNTFAANTESLQCGRDELRENILAACENARRAAQEATDPDTNQAAASERAENVLSGSVASSEPAAASERAENVLSGAAQECFIAGDIGPIPMTGPESGKMMTDEYRFIIDTFLAAGIRILVFETFSETDEILPAIRYCRETYREENPFILVEICVNMHGYTNTGLGASKLIGSLAKCPDIDAVGFNCGIGPGYMKQVMDRIDMNIPKFVSVMPNAGFPQSAAGRMVFRSNDEYFALKMKDIAAAGADIIGGCCGTNPSVIRRMARDIDLTAAGHHFPVPDEAGKSAGEKHDGSFFSEENHAAAQRRGTCSKYIAVELAPPYLADDRKLMDAANGLLRLPVDVITLPDSPSGRTRADSILTGLKVGRETGITVMPHICCRDRNIIAVRSALMGAHMNGIRNLLVITGDPVPTMMRQEAKSVFNFDSVGLMRIIREMNGEQFPDDPIFYGGAINYNRRNIEVEFSRVRKKIEAGASFFLTQPVFTAEDAEKLRRFKAVIDAAAPAGGEKAKLLCGLMPLISRKNALFIQNEMSGINVTDDIVDRYRTDMTRAEGEAVGEDVVRNVIRMTRDFVDGYYFSIPFNRVYMLKEILPEI